MGNPVPRGSDAAAGELDFTALIYDGYKSPPVGTGFPRKANRRPAAVPTDGL